MEVLPQTMATCEKIRLGRAGHGRIPELSGSFTEKILELNGDMFRPWLMTPGIPK